MHEIGQKVEGKVLAKIRTLEESLWEAETRYDNDYMERIFSSDFVEFGRSGRRYQRSEMFFDERTRHEIGATLPLPEFQARYIAHDVIQTTYVSETVADETVVRANRASVWSLVNEEWKLRFHQGTPVENNEKAKKPSSLLRSAKMELVPLLIISGPVGVGKTSTAEEVSNQLVGQEIAHTLIDLDTLAETYPRPQDDTYGSWLALQNLKAMWKNCYEAGSKNIVMARVIEKIKDRQAIENAIPLASSIVCELTASDETLIRRVKKREIGTGYEWHKARSLELSQQLSEHSVADFKVSTDDRSVEEIAAEICSQIRWQS